MIFYKKEIAVLILLLTVNQVSLKAFNQLTDSLKVLPIGSRLELFIDDYLISELRGGANLRMHAPIPKEVVIVHDEDWEGSGSGYHSVFKDGDLYRMYYKSWQHEASSDMRNYHPLFCAYAESMDGINWVKPNLGIHDFNGSKSNNIVMISGKMGKFNIDAGHPAVFKDTNPSVSKDAVYKAVLALQNPDYGLVALKSPDGIHWSLLSDSLIMKNGHFDSQNLAFWDDINKVYRLYWRQYVNGVRGVQTAISKDFINWIGRTDVVYPNRKPEQLYTNQIKPYDRAPHIFIGFPARYVDRGWTQSTKMLPELEEREKRGGKSTKGGALDLNSRFGTALSESLLISSRDGVNFYRWEEAFLRPGMERKGTWTYGDAYIGWHIVETKSNSNDRYPELSIYATENYWKGKGSMLRRYTLRLDGFGSINAPMSGGEIITKPLKFKGDSLVLNFSSSAAGDIRVEILDEFGAVIPTYGSEDSDIIFGDTIERTVTWRGKSSLHNLNAKNIRLRFIIRDADLYSIQFK